ncbi:MAG: hypothetical protein HN919_01815 [Verrucomicrobia bacterium]|jgi:predicted transcriptional regulator|nr:hypothetical protein [Verrucomicrobiota bacterium]
MKKPSNEAKSEFLSIRIARTTKDALERIAVAEERSLSWIVGKIIEDYIARKGAER